LEDYSMGNGWQPIETAPKDGTRILFWDAKREVAISGRWHDDPGRDDPNGFEPPWAWWCADDDLILWDGGREDVPSHWMPLTTP
jgi:hypothetical protein